MPEPRLTAPGVCAELRRILKVKTDQEILPAVAKLVSGSKKGE